MTRRKPLSPERSLRRRRPRFEPRARFLLLCEGRVTEPEYFNFVRDELREHMIVIKVASNKGDPLDLVEATVEMRDEALARARQAKDENLRYDPMLVN